jgi:hypothetical protein
MDSKALIPLPIFDAVAQTAAEFLTKGKNVAIVGPPGSGTTSVGARVQQEISAAKLPCAVFDCAAEGDISQRLTEFTGPKRKAGKNGVILIDHGSSLPLSQLENVAARVNEITKECPTASLWLGGLDAREIKAASAIELGSDTRSHLCLPELGRDALLRLYHSIATRDERLWGRWGEAMLYFVLDWCGNDLSLVEDLVEHFYGDWTENIYDESVAECLGNWLKESPAVRGYRNRYAALPDSCKKQLQLLCNGGKLRLRRPEIHLEPSDDIRLLFLNGFLSMNLLPGYYQFRNLLARYVVEEQIGRAPAPINLLRRSANSRINALLQDIEVALRAMLRSVFLQMSADEVRTLLKSTKTEQKLYEPDLQRTLLDWAGNLPLPAPQEAKAELAKLLKEKREEFEANSNLWTKVCSVFSESLGPGVGAEPTPEQGVGCLTFAELSALLQTLADRLFLNKPSSGRIIDSPKKRWPEYLTKVRRLRNEAAHLRNISFQDIEDLLEILNAVRRDQLDFLIIP